MTGRDVGTPILHFRPPTGTAFFGPVISRLPSADDAVSLWDHVIALAEFPGFAEIKRSMRERPQLVALGVDPESVGSKRTGTAAAVAPRSMFADAVTWLDMAHGRHFPQLGTLPAGDEILRACPYLGLPAHQRSRRRQAALVSGGTGDHDRPYDRTPAHHTDPVSG